MMSRSTRKFLIGAAATGALGAIVLATIFGISAWTQLMLTEANGEQALAQPGTQSCWHPGLSRNIGIAELSCDVLDNARGSIRDGEPPAATQEGQGQTPGDAVAPQAQ